MLGRTSIPRISHASSHSENVASVCRVMLVGIRDFQAKSEESQRNQDGWIVCTDNSYFLWRKEAAQAILLFKNSLCFLKVLERHFKLSHSSYVHHKYYQYCNLMKFVELKRFASSPRATGHTFHQNRKYCMGCFQVSSWILPCIIC